ncbi:MAG: hypothetical protein GY719_25925 [bacterium]|nr:hypothetical protein [bacterium]
MQNQIPKIEAEAATVFRLTLPGGPVLRECSRQAVVDDLVLWKGKLGDGGGWLLTAGGGSGFAGFFGSLFGNGADASATLPVIAASANVAAALKVATTAAASGAEAGSEA